MRRHPSAEHQQAVSRRLALLSQELSTLSTGPGPEAGAGAAETSERDHTRVRADAFEPTPDPGPIGSGPPRDLLPRRGPGRHAARRAGWSPASLLPESLRGRVAVGPAHLAVVAVLVALGLAVTTWWVARSESRPVAAPSLGAPVPALATPAGEPQSPTGASVTAVAPGIGSTSPAGQVTVDVAGKVRRPGIAVLDEGARVVDALAAAGGARPGVDLRGLNLARLLVDGEQVLVGVPVPAGAVGALGAAPGTTPPPALVNLNTATESELESLPEVGPVTAQAILAWRTEHGGFSSVEELLEVDGIGEATLATIAPHATV